MYNLDQRSLQNKTNNFFDKYKTFSFLKRQKTQNSHEKIS